MYSLKTYISIVKSVKNRPTKIFFFLIIAIVTLFLQAYMHNYNIVFLVMFFLVAIAGNSSLFGMLNLYFIELKLLSNERFFAQSSSSFKLLVKNNSDSTSYDINITSNEQNVNIKLIEARNTQTVEFEQRFEIRGEATLSPFKVHSLFPLPHETKYKLVTLEQKFIVYPKPEGISLLEIYNHDNSFQGEMDEFEGIKRFNQGENLSYINWASLAKQNLLMSKNFIFTQPSQKLHFDFATLNGDDETRLSQLTLWVLECEKYNFDFTLKISDQTLDSKKMSTDEILQTLAKY